jgi:HSP20 family protein
VSKNEHHKLPEEQHMLMRFDPFRELDRLASAPWARPRPVLPMDAYRNGDQFVVHFDLPGVDPESIDLTVEKNVLTVTAERNGATHEGDDVLASERFHGRYTRQLFLGEALDADGIQANYEHGVLTVTIPVAQQAKARKVEITTGAPAVTTGEPTAIDAGDSQAA